MGIKTSKNHLLVAAAFVFAFTAAGCVSENNGTTEPGRDAAFLGYSNPDTKQTTCGNCHVDVQAEWRETKHANAWADLQASGSAQPFCSRCHTTNGLTNGVGDSTGFFAVSADARPFYQDVQCESCHGPGAAHVSAPGETQPIPTMLAENTTYADGCTACHNGTHQPFAEQLAASRHGIMPYWGNRGCQVPCHNGMSAMQVYNPRFQYRDQVVGDTTVMKAMGRTGLSCSICHQPHDAEDNPAQLRFQGVNTTDSAQHVCGKCHNRGPVASAAAGSWRSSRGAHSAQFANLMGYGGYDWGMVGAR
ncbi:MAG: multiheme c-type cytochrome, partial [Gemmatimonadota bacterium]